MSTAESGKKQNDEVEGIAGDEYKFLCGMSPNDTPAVISVLTAANNEISTAERNDSLRILLKDETRYQEYLLWKRDQDEPARLNFFKLVRPALHSVCQKMLDKGNLKGLEVVLRNEGDDVLRALSALKSEREQKKKEQIEASSQDPPSLPETPTVPNKTKPEGKQIVEHPTITSNLLLSKSCAKYVDDEWKKFEAIQQLTEVTVSLDKGGSGLQIILSTENEENLLRAELMVMEVLWNDPDLIQSSMTVKNCSLNDEERVSFYKKSLSVLVKYTGNEFLLRAESAAALEDGKKHLNILLKTRQYSSSLSDKKEPMLTKTIVVDHEVSKKKVDNLKKIGVGTGASIRHENINGETRIYISSDDKKTISETVEQMSQIFNDTSLTIGPNVLANDGDNKAAESSKSESLGYSSDSSLSDSNSMGIPGRTPMHNEVDDDESLSFPDNMTVLFLGETGAGKSTAINALVNYLKYTDIEDAVNNPTVLIKSSFTLTKRDTKMSTVKIVTEPTFSCEDTHQSNEDTTIGASCTQDAKAYNFTWKIGSKKKTIKIIDTPGIGDVRGIEYDKKNFAKILDYIADYPELTAICILIQPDARRLTPAFKFCMDELLVHLHKNASKNIMFCFTGTRSTFYRPGETYPTLKEHLERLERTRDVEIPLSPKTMFCVDNEGFRYICASKRNYPFTDAQRQLYAKSYKHSATEIRRMFKQMKELPVHKVNDTLCLNNTRSLILALATPLAEISKNLTFNTKLLEDKVAEVDKLKKEGGKLEDKLYTEQLIISAQEVNYPKTVCTAPRCVEYRKFHPSHPHMMTFYKTVCHAHCYLTGVQAESCPNDTLRDCLAMGRAEGEIRCRICGCSWDTHMHIRYELETKMEKMVDPDVQAALKNNDSGVSAAEIFTKKTTDKIAELRKESKMIMEYSASFSTFLNKNSIMPYNDSYRQYLDFLITQEKGKVALSGDDSLLKSLENDKEKYEQQIIILNNAAAIGGAERDIYEINNMIDELKKSSHGTTLKEVQKLEILSVRQAQEHQSINVPINSGSIMGSLTSTLMKPINYLFGGKQKSENVATPVQKQQKNKKNRKK